MDNRARQVAGFLEARYISAARRDSSPGASRSLEPERLARCDRTVTAHDIRDL